jgi:hypothetical protein
MRFTPIAVAVLALAPLSLAQSVETQLKAASQTIEPVMRRAEPLVTEGKVTEANRLVQDTFPEASRTPAQCLLLANVLYKQLPKVSYELHKKAAAGLADYPNAQFEWAMEQHRSGEYAAAAETYRAFLNAKPDAASAWGLLAECLIRTGDTVGAVDAWKSAEKALGNTRSGTRRAPSGITVPRPDLEQFEEFVCEVNGKPDTDAAREILLKSVAAGDCAAAAKLLLLDADWERDWWNKGPRKAYLDHDLPLVKASACASQPAVKAAIAAAECAQTASADSDEDSPKARTPSVESILEKYGFLVDPAHTLPVNGKALSLLLGYALDSDAISKEAAREKFGEAIIALAKRTKDRDAYNAAAHLYLGTSRLADIDRAGWEDTHDPVFAASLLMGLVADKSLKAGSPDLQKAVKEFPENAEIAQINLAAAAEADQPLEPLLVNAIKAEYRHFSTREAFGGLAPPRPRAETLRAYFKVLDQARSDKLPASEKSKPAD